jgi:hypothetical protein
VQYPGRPQGGDSYATYLCCFSPEPAKVGLDYQDDQIDILYLGEVVTTLTPDEDGGVLVELPLVDPLTKPGPVTIQARSRQTGKTLTDTINPAPSVAALWATSSAPRALEITGLDTSVNGRVHSESDLTLRGSGLNLTGGTEYVTSLSTLVVRSAINPAPQKVPAGGSPLIRTVADFRPGSPQAIGAGADFHAIDPSQCSNGVWRPAPGRALTGIVYVPCGVEIFGQNSTVGAVIAAEGPIAVTGSNVTVDAGRPGLPSLVSGAKGADAIRIVGANVKAAGTVFAPGGGVQFIGLGGVFRCGAVASTIRVLGARNSVVIDGSCRIDG